MSKKEKKERKTTGGRPSAAQPQPPRAPGLRPAFPPTGSGGGEAAARLSSCNARRLARSAVLKEREEEADRGGKGLRWRKKK